MAIATSNIAPPPLPHLRSTNEFRRDGIEFASGSDEFAKLFDASLYQMYGMFNAAEYEQGMTGTIARMREADPFSPLPDTFTLYAAARLKLPSASSPANIVHSLAAALKQQTDSSCLSTSSSPAWTPYETDHVRVALCFARNFDELGRAMHEELLVRRPRDLLAGFQSFVRDNESGNYARRLANIRAVRHSCCGPSSSSSSSSTSSSSTAAAAYTSFLLAMEAFGHEEVNELAAAQQLAEEAVQRLAWNPWAHHSLAHVYDARRDATAGLDRLTQHRADWRRGTLLTGHIEWHRGLLHLEREDLHAALGVVDEALWPRVSHEHSMLNMSDMTTLLMRMEMMVQQWSGKSDSQKAEFKSEIDERWADLIGWLARPDGPHRYNTLLGKTNRMETDVIMASLAGKRGDLTNQLRAVFQQRLEDDADNDDNDGDDDEWDSQMARDILLVNKWAPGNREHDGLLLLAKDAHKYFTKSKTRFIQRWKLDFIDAMRAFFDKEYDTCASLLYPHRQHFYAIGGSIAQNEIYAQILAFSLAKASSVQHHARLRKYLIEQSAQRDHKNLIEKISANFMVQHMNDEEN